MEDYIYILVGLLWIVFSVIKANKKAKQQLPETTEYEDYEETTAPERTTFDELLEEFLGEKARTEAPPPAYEPIPQQKYQPIETFTSGIEDFENRISGPEQTYNMDESPIFSMDDERSPFLSDQDIGMFEKNLNQSQAFRSAKTRFDLRQAVIYSAVLNRPYA